MRVKPEKGKFYVYALCRPNGIPFYIGKGINDRVNIHFSESYLKVENHKNHIIRKYGNQIKREIVAYFDSEETAYEYEEWLISNYGLECDGGLLVNYAKSRFEYSHLFYQDVVVKSVVANKKRLAPHTVFCILRDFFYYGLSYEETSKNNGCTKAIIEGVVVKGRQKHLYDKYVTSGKIKSNRHLSSRKGKSNRKNRKVSDEDVVSAFEKYSTGLESIVDLARGLGMSRGQLSKIFNGGYRPDLNLKDRPVKFLLKTSDKHCITHFSKVYSDWKDNNLPCSELSRKYCIPYTTVTRICKLEGRYAYIPEYLDNK